MATVIKAGQSGAVRRQLVTVDLADHLAEARSVVEQAQRRAVEIEHRAQRERTQTLEEARTQGHKEGYEAGQAEGIQCGREAAFEEAMERFQREHAVVVEDLQRVIDALDGMHEELRLAAGHHLLNFAVGVARKLTFDVGVHHREAAAANLDRALRLLGTKTSVTVRAHPDDVASLETFAASALSRIEQSRSVRIVADDGIAPGGCTVATEGTEIDATLETQTTRLVSLLLGEEAEDA